jgi:DNA invertase Pin-like site-specific DNA recombinase
MTDRNGPDLSGDGAGYVRVSDDQQDTLRQVEAIHAFERRFGVTILKRYWFEDEGWARDTADTRPDFQRLLREAEDGRIKWIVVDQLDRFGTRDAHQLVHYLFLLRKWGCRLYDGSGKEWTGADIATILTAVVEGDESRREQTTKSHRVLGGKAVKAQAGEWQGGPVHLGLEVVCFDRATGEERWRVVPERRGLRWKVFPDGRRERFEDVATYEVRDGGRRLRVRPNFPKAQADEVLRVAPSNDRAKVDAAAGTFRRFAAESVSLSALAHDLNARGYRNGYGGHFQAHHVRSLLTDPAYLGRYAWNRSHCGKFHRLTKEGPVPDTNYGRKTTANAREDWTVSRDLFAPLVDAKTWDAVARKLDRPKPDKAPRSAALFLAGLVACGNCKALMVAGPRPKKGTGREEYYCGTYHKAVREKRRHECKCLRNGVYQDVLAGYVERYLDETGRKLAVLLGEPPTADPRTRRLEAEEGAAWADYQEGFERLTAYLAEQHPEEYAALLEEDAERGRLEAQVGDATPGVLANLDDVTRARLDEAIRRHADDPTRHYGPGPREGEFLANALAAYRDCFDPARLRDEVAAIEAEHTALMHRYADLPTPRAKDKAKAELSALEARIAALERQQQDLGETITNALGELRRLAQAVHDARKALAAGEGERALRRRAQALRAVIARITCTFVATGKTGGGPGKANSRLVRVVIEPVLGEPREYAGPDVVQPSGVSTSW